MFALNLVKQTDDAIFLTVPAFVTLSSAWRLVCNVIWRAEDVNLNTAKLFPGIPWTNSRSSYADKKGGGNDKRYFLLPALAILLS